MKFRKKPVEVEAIRWEGNNGREVKAWLTERTPAPSINATPELVAAHDVARFIKRRSTGMSETLWGNVAQHTWGEDITAAVWDHFGQTYVGVRTGDWIVCGTEGEFYPCVDDGTGTAPLNYVRVRGLGEGPPVTLDITHPEES